MKKESLISTEIERFYSNVSDENRYTKGLGPLELERNKELILRHIKSTNSIIVDVGGGTGVYSEWLAQLGHRVHLTDPVAKHIYKAKARSSNSKQKFNCTLGEARSLEFPDNFADMVILHGPLYHLQSRNERLKAITEAKRVCKKNGVVIGIAINYFSYTLAGLLNGMIHDPTFYEMCKKQLTSGIHNPPKNNSQLFLPEAYFHRPDELLNEFNEACMVDLSIYAVEGFSWLDKNFFQTREDPVKKKAILSLLKLMEQDSALLSFSPHMMIVGKK